MGEAALPAQPRVLGRVGGLVVATALLVPVTTQLAAASPQSVHAKKLTLGTACAGSNDPATSSVARLGAGVSLRTGVDGNLFTAGRPARLLVTAPSSGPATQQVRLQVRNETQSVGMRQASLSRAPAKPARAAAPRTVAVPHRPGWYQVRAERVSGGRVLGVSCLWYGVGMAGSSLNLAGLPAGKDWGGPAPLRDVALNAQLGLNVARYQFSVASFLDNPDYADPQLTEAAQRARRLGTRFVVQIGQGGAAETSAVKNGTWGHLVRRIVSTYPAVRNWEAWNEPNAGEFFYGSTKTYVDRVLVPAAKAIHAANPKAKVVGGSAIGDDPGWWRKFAALGGFGDLDAIGVNPYTSNLGAPETAGLRAVLQLVRRLAASHGAAHKPILDTESAWPSSYPNVHANLATQSDYVSRKFVLERALGVSSGEYLVEGGWENWDIIDYFRGVKPAAMALSATATLLTGRHFIGWVKTGVSQVWAARFSGTSHSSRQLIVTWSSGAAKTLRLTCSRSGFNSFGAAKSLHGHVAATGSLSFASVPAGSHCLS